MNLKKYLINALALTCVAIAPIAAIACAKTQTPAKNPGENNPGNNDNQGGENKDKTSTPVDTSKPGDQDSKDKENKDKTSTPADTSKPGDQDSKDKENKDQQGKDKSETEPKSPVVSSLTLVNNFSTKDEATKSLNSATEFVHKLFEYCGSEDSSTKPFSFVYNSKALSYTKAELIEKTDPTLAVFTPNGTHGTTVETALNGLIGKIQTIKDNLANVVDYNEESKEEFESEFASFFENNLNGLLPAGEDNSNGQPSLDPGDTLVQNPLLSTIKTLGYDQLNDETLNQVKESSKNQFNSLNLLSLDGIKTNDQSGADWASKNKDNNPMDDQNLVNPSETYYANLPELANNKKAELLSQLQPYLPASNAIAAIFGVENLNSLGESYWLIPLNKAATPQDKYKDGNGLHIRKLEGYIIFNDQTGKNVVDDTNYFLGLINNLASSLSLNQEGKITGGDLANAQERALNLLRELNVSNINEANVKKAVSELYNQYLNRAKVVFWYKHFATVKNKENQATSITFSQLDKEISDYEKEKAN